MRSYVLDFKDIDRDMTHRVGGKGANLGALARLDGVRVPPGFCVTTDAFTEAMATLPAIDAPLAALAALAPEDREAIAPLAAAVRRAIEAVAIPEAARAAIAARLDPARPYAVRSSATAEDLPAASFAGQQDSYLDVVGVDAVLDAVRRCWASLFTDRAVAYRLRNGFDHHAVRLAVVVQDMVPAEAAGVLFTADPLSGDRKKTTIDAVRGLGEALVAGHVVPDAYAVRAGAITRKPAGDAPVLTDDQIRTLEALGRRIEAHFGRPQDVEWCLADGGFAIVQARPITTLFPIPDAGDDAPHVYLSVGHQQMMTDALRPLGLSIRQLTSRPMYVAGGRQFVDIAAMLASPAARGTLVDNMDQHDPLMADAVRTLLARQGVETGPPAPPPAAFEPKGPDDPAIPAGLIAETEASVAALKETLRGKAGPAVFAAIREDFPEMKRVLFDPRSNATFMSAIQAAAWLNAHVEAWLGEKGVADVLSQSVPNNVTSEMGLALLDVADVVRPHPAVVDYLAAARDEGFLEGLDGLAGGPAVRAALEAFLAKYGMRGVAEIDLTRPRWREQPTALVPMILANVRAFAPGEAARRFEHGRREALAKRDELLARVAALPDGAAKAARVEEAIRYLRGYIGYREYPKYGIVCRFMVYKDALMREARALAAAGVVPDPEDVFYLTFEELEEAVRTHHVDPALVAARKAQHAIDQRMMPPRVMTSDGEVLAGTYRHAALPAGAIAGLAVSAGVVEGRARVVADPADALLAPGDILVTKFTDPSWTPLFVAIGGLVTEVGGLMTHGAVIAREYGLPAVVGVDRATERIRDGQRVRVHGTEGWVELL